MQKRILIVDDNKDILDVVEETLTYEKFEVLATSDSDDVPAKAVSFKPDLVLLDYRLGNITGGEICRELKAMPEFSEVPVIIFTAYINRSEELFTYGCDATIEKPFDMSELITKVNDLVKSRS